MERKEQELEEKRKLLKSITSEEFVSKLVENCTAVEVGQSSSWGLKSKKEDRNERLRSSLLSDLASLIGDAGLTEDEKNAREMEELRLKQGSQAEEDDDVAIARLSASSPKRSGELVGSREQLVEGPDGKKTIKKSVLI